MKLTTKRSSLQLFVAILCSLVWLAVGTTSPASAKASAAAPARGICCAPQPEPHQKGKKDGRPEQFKKDLQAFITKEAGLTAEEAQRFFPVFFEMKEKLHSLERQNHRALRKAAQSGNEKDCQRALDNQNRLNLKACKMEQQYTQRLVRIVGAKKYAKVLEAEHKFGRKMFHRMAGKKGPRK